MSAWSVPDTGRRHVGGVVGAAAASLAILVAACGGSGTGSVGATTASGYSSPIGLSRCMRAHGLPTFPDPTMGPGGEGFNGIGRSIDGTTVIVDGKTFSGPAATRAEKACRRYLQPSGPPPQLSAGQKRARLAFARCMRTHGVPTFPDPIFPTSGGTELRLPAGLNPQSPSFQHASQACGGPRFGP